MYQVNIRVDSIIIQIMIRNDIVSCQKRREEGYLKLLQKVRNYYQGRKGCKKVNPKIEVNDNYEGYYVKDIFRPSILERNGIFKEIKQNIEKKLIVYVEALENIMASY